MQLAVAPQGECAGPVWTGGAVAVTDRTDRPRTIGIMQRHPLRVGLRGLRDDRLAVGAAEGWRGEILGTVERPETIQAFEPTERLKRGRTAPSSGVAIGLSAPGIGQDLVDKLNFILIKFGGWISEALACVLQEASQSGLATAEFRRQRRGGEAEKCADARGQFRAGGLQVAACPGSEPWLERCQRFGRVVRQFHAFVSNELPIGRSRAGRD